MFFMKGGCQPFRVWRSTDSGRTWSRIINIPKVRMQTPVVLHRTVSGAPFIAANPCRSVACDKRGRTILSLWVREDLCLWRLTPDRRGLENPVNVFDARTLFGPAPDEGSWFVNFWYVDHPMGGVFRLADEKLHCLLFIRVLLLSEPAAGTMPAKYTGCWVGEVFSKEKNSLPVWRF